MKTGYLAACVVAATMSAAPLAFSAPVGGTQVTQFRTMSDYADGSACAGNVCTYFHAQVYDGDNGVPQGYATSQINDYNTFDFSYVECNGPVYVAVSLNQGNGAATVSGTLDPAAPGCVGYNTSAVTLNLSGRADGNYHTSQNGTAKQQSGATTWKYNFQSDAFSESFTGTVGHTTGNFLGYSGTERNGQRQQVK